MNVLFSEHHADNFTSGLYSWLMTFKYALAGKRYGQPGRAVGTYFKLLCGATQLELTIKLLQNPIHDRQQRRVNCRPWKLSTTLSPAGHSQHKEFGIVCATNQRGSHVVLKNPRKLQCIVSVIFNDCYRFFFFHCLGFALLFAHVGYSRSGIPAWNVWLEFQIMAKYLAVLFFLPVGGSVSQIKHIKVLRLAVSQCAVCLLYSPLQS